MLVLTRKLGESVILGNSIRVRVIEVSSNTVRLGFEAPPDVSIYREEIHREIAAANRAAVNAPDGCDVARAAAAAAAAADADAGADGAGDAAPAGDAGQDGDDV